MTPAIAQYLHAEGIQAVFFINGERFIGQQRTGCPLGEPYDYPLGQPKDGHHNPSYRTYDEAILDTLVQYGHRIANHTHDHCDVGVHTSYLAAELRPTQAILDRHAFDGPFLFRPPYGSWVAQDGVNGRADPCLDKVGGLGPRIEGRQMPPVLYQRRPSIRLSTAPGDGARRQSALEQQARSVRWRPKPRRS